MKHSIKIFSVILAASSFLTLHAADARSRSASKPVPVAPMKSAVRTLIMATTPGIVIDPAANIAVKLRILTPEKLQSALDDAVSAGDPYSPDCYRALQPIVQAATDANATAAKPSANGVSINLVLIYQKLRDTRRAAQSIQAMLNGGGNVDLIKACAPMVLDSESVINSVVAAIGGAALIVPK